MPSLILTSAGRRRLKRTAFDLHLKGSATLIRLPQIAAELESLKPGTNVHVHVEDLDYIDHACIDLFTSWDKQHRASGGSLSIEWEHLTRKYHERSSGRLRAGHEAAKAGA